MRRRQIVFDFDDVLVQDAFLELLEKYIGKKIDRSKITNYYLEKEFLKTEEELQHFFDYFMTQNMYEYGYITEGAKELLEKLNKDYEVLIFSAVVFDEAKDRAGILFKHKYEFIRKEFPFLNPSNIILGGNKSIIQAKYFIDDRIDHLENSNAEIKVLYSAPHNRGCSDKELYQKNIIRVSSMEEIEKMIYGKYSLQKMCNRINESLIYLNFSIRVVDMIQKNIFHKKCAEVKDSIEVHLKRKIVVF